MLVLKIAQHKGFVNYINARSKWKAVECGGALIQFMILVESQSLATVFESPRADGPQFIGHVVWVIVASKNLSDGTRVDYLLKFNFLQLVIFLLLVGYSHILHYCCCR